MRAWLCELAIVQGLKTLRINKAIPFGLDLIIMSNLRTFIPSQMGTAGPAA